MQSTNKNIFEKLLLTTEAPVYYHCKRDGVLAKYICTPLHGDNRIIPVYPGDEKKALEEILNGPVLITK